MTVKPVRIRRESVGNYIVSCVFVAGEYKGPTDVRPDDIHGRCQF